MPRRASRAKARIMLSEVRRRQRAHAKKRFEQRFALNMNRDQIHEIEVKIVSGQAVLVERRTASQELSGRYQWRVGRGGVQHFDEAGCNCPAQKLLREASERANTPGTLSFTR